MIQSSIRPALNHRELAFSQGEYERRAAAVQEAMLRAGIDVMLATTLASVCYLSGIESVSPHKLWAVAVPKTGKPRLFCQDFESHNARLSSWLQPEFKYPVVGDAIGPLAGMLKEIGAGGARIGTETAYCWSSLSVQGFLRLKEMLPGATFVDATDCVGRVMAIKSPPEIACIRRAAGITSDGMAAAIDAVRDGATDNDVAAAAYGAMIGAGSEYSSYPVIVTTGARSGIPHSTFRRTPINRGDAVFIELAAVINRYHAPMMRTAVLGEPPPRLRQLTGAAVACVNRLIEEIRPGRAVADVASAAQERLASLAPDVVWHGYYGYSVGLGFPPEWSDCSSLVIRLDGKDVLRAGMVFHVSTSLRDVGVCGATCCETIFVTDAGCEVLTRGARELAIR
jgi:Xaa-Pro dipeptidase